MNYTKKLNGYFYDFDEKQFEEDFQTIIDSLKEKKYDPTKQISEYIISGDPTYITSHNDARRIMTVYDRTDVLTYLLNKHIGK